MVEFIVLPKTSRRPNKHLLLRITVLQGTLSLLLTNDYRLWSAYYLLDTLYVFFNTVILQVKWITKVYKGNPLQMKHWILKRWETSQGHTANNAVLGFSYSHLCVWSRMLRWLPQSILGAPPCSKRKSRSGPRPDGFMGIWEIINSGFVLSNLWILWIFVRDFQGLILGTRLDSSILLPEKRLGLTQPVTVIGTNPIGIKLGNFKNCKQNGSQQFLFHVHGHINYWTEIKFF